MTGMASPAVRERVIHICLSPSWGGLEMYPGRVTPALLDQGWEVFGVALSGTQVATSMQDAGAETLVFRSQAHALCRVIQILRYLKAHDIRVVHAHKSSDMRLCALLAALWPRIRLFFTDHMGVKKPKKDIYHRWAYSKVWRLFSISQVTYQRNVSAFPLPKARIQQLYYGINLTAYEPVLDESERTSIRQSLGVDEAAIAIALPGRISESKGHGCWVDALAQLRGKPGLPPWQGVIIGEAGGLEAMPGGFADKLKARVGQLGLSKNVVFTGFRNDLARCLMAMDIVCIPSINEAFGLSVVEAMAAGCPVVGSNAGAIPELITADRGCVAPPDDPFAWADALVDLIANEPQRLQLGANASRWVNANFGLDSHVSRLVAAYEQSAE